MGDTKKTLRRLMERGIAPTGFLPMYHWANKYGLSKYESDQLRVKCLSNTIRVGVYWFTEDKPPSEQAISYITKGRQRRGV